MNAPPELDDYAQTMLMFELQQRNIPLIVKPLPLTVGEFNALMEIVKLEQCKITI